MAKFPQYYQGWKITERLTPFDHYYVATKTYTLGIGKNKIAANTLIDIKREIDRKGEYDT